MNLVGLVVAGQRVHHQVDAEPEGHLALPLTAGNHREKWVLRLIHGPGSSPVVATNNDRRNAVVDPLADTLDPQRAAGPSTRELAHQVEGAGQDVIGRDRHQRRNIEFMSKPGERFGTGALVTGVE